MEPGIRKWGFLLTEMVLIVASILFAFALDSWWDQRQLVTEEREILLGLQEEFVLNRSKLETRMAMHEGNLAAVEQFHIRQPHDARTHRVLQMRPTGLVGVGQVGVLACHAEQMTA